MDNRTDKLSLIKLALKQTLTENGGRSSIHELERKYFEKYGRINFQLLNVQSFMDIVAGFPEMFQLDGVCVLFRSALEIPHPSPSSPQPQFHEYETQQDFSNDPMTKFLTDCAERLKDAGPPKIQLNRYDSIDSCEEEKLLWDLNELTLEELKKRFHETNPFLPDILREYFSQSNKASNNSKENALNFSNAVYEIDQDDFEINSSQYETLNGSETSYEECQGSCAIVGNNDYQYSAYCDSICSHENYQEMLLEYSCVSSD